MCRVAIRLVFPGHVLIFGVKNSVQADVLNLAKCPGFLTNDNFNLSLFPINLMLSQYRDVSEVSVFYVWQQRILCLTSVFCLKLLSNHPS